jgi:hypothetical protein
VRVLRQDIRVGNREQADAHRAGQRAERGA